MKRKPLKLGALLLSLIALLILSISSVFALEPEELTNFDLRDEYGRKITVEYYQPTGKWQALAEGNETIYTGLAPNSDGMWYCRTGVVDFTYNGLVEFQDDIWYVENGKVNTDYHGEQTVGNQVYTIAKGKVVDQDYTKDTKQKMTLLVAGMVAIVALIIISRWRKRQNKKKKLEKERQLREEVKKEREKAREERRQRELEEEKAERERKLQIARETYRDEVENNGLTYKKVEILTPREKEFYPHLKSVADKLGYSVSMKTRLGDLVSGADTEYSSQGMKERNKVWKKHVDFALFDPEAQEVKLLVELDDTTHEMQSRINRDYFVDRVLKGTSYKILHVYDTDNLEEKILEELNKEEAEETQNEL